MTTTDEWRTLGMIEALARELAASGDPLMVSQYRLLLDRVRALRSVLAADASELSEQS